MNPTPKPRKIIHIDMDCFYAAIEMRDAPHLRSLPIAVGGSPDGRGVLCTANYLAREYGVRSAMASYKALKLCPDLVIVPVDFAKYRSVAHAIRKIFYSYTDLVEPLSLDEAYLDVTDCELFDNQARLIAKAICQEIIDTQHLTASAGVAPNKFLAKVASDWRKPNGIFVIPPQKVASFVQKLPVEKIFGVGKVTQRKMQQFGIYTCQDLQALSMTQLIERFGTFGQRLYDMCRGKDSRLVSAQRSRKSLSVETTFTEDLKTLSECATQLQQLYPELTRRLTRVSDRAIHKLCLKIKLHDFKQTTVECTHHELDLSKFMQLLQQGYARYEQSVRLIGIGVGFRAQEEVMQGEFLF